MLTLYEHSTSVCVVKVRLTLLEKNIPYEGKFIDLRRGEQFDPAYLKIHPDAVVPALVDDGHVFRESSVIQYYLEDRFPEPRMMPEDILLRYRQRRLMKMIDDPVHAGCGLLTQGLAFRKDFSSPEKIEKRMAQIPDPRRRDRQRSVFTHGADSPYVKDAVRDYHTLLAEMETALAEGPWLGGDLYSLADAAATPYVNRLDILHIAEPFLSKFPHVSDWFDRVRARPTFAKGITDHYTDDDEERFRPAEADSDEKIAAILNAL